ESHDPEEQHRRDAKIAADGGVSQRLDPDATSLVRNRELAGKLVGNRAQVGFSRVNRHPWLQTSHSLQSIEGAGLRWPIEHRLHRPQTRLPEQLKIPGDDANDGPQVAVQTNLAADQGGVGVEARAPERLAQDHHGRSLEIVVPREGSPRDRRHTKDVEYS